MVPHPSWCVMGVVDAFCRPVVEVAGSTPVVAIYSQLLFTVFELKLVVCFFFFVFISDDVVVSALP